MNDELKLEDEDWEARLQQALAAMPQERAPASLQRRLRAIPGRDRGLMSRLLQRPAWALALVPLALVVLLYQEQREQRELELQLAQAREELAVALRYIDRANRRAGEALLDSLDEGLSRPVNQNTYTVLREHLDITQEL